MKTFIKWTVVTAASLLLLITLLLAYILLVLDPNSYKTELQELARAEGVDLEIKGDLAWRLFPNLAIEIGETSFTSDSLNLPKSRFQHALLRVDLLALLQDRIAVQAIHITGADIELREVAQGAAVAAVPATSSKPAEIGDSRFSLAVNAFSIRNSRLLVPGEAGPMELTQLNLEGSDFNLDGQQFPLQLATRLQLPGSPKPVGIDFNGALAVSLKGGTVKLSDANLGVSDLLAVPLKLAFSAEAGLTGQSASISAFNGSLGDLSFTGDLALTSLDTSPAASGSLVVAPFNLKTVMRQWQIEPPATRSAKAMSQVGLQGRFAASASEVSLDNLVIILDQTRINGKFKLALTAPRQLQLSLVGDSINIDDYLAPATEAAATAQPATSPDAALFLPLLAPLALLEGGNGNIDMSWQKIMAEGITLDQPQMALNVKGKQLNLSKFTTGVFGGSVSATASLNLATAEPSIKIQKQITGLDMGTALAAFMENADMGGKLTMDLNATSKGNSIEAIQANLQGGGMFRVEQPQLKTINIEQNYCELAAMVEKQPARAEPWPKGTTLNQVDGRYRLNGHDLVLDSFATGLGNLKLSGNGVIKSDKETFDIRLVTNLQGERTSEAGCPVKSKRVRNRDIALHCKDSFAKAGSTSCKPDQEVVKSLIQDRVLEEIKQRSGSDNETMDAVEGLLKGILGGGSKK